MKKILLILIFAIMSMSMYSQKIPTVNAHITSQQYQIDEFVSSAGIIYRAKSITTSTPPGVDWIDITQEGAQGGAAIVILNEGNGNGFIPSGSDRSFYGNIGRGAFDLSGSFSPSLTIGATGDYSMALGYLSTASGYGSFNMGQEGFATGTYAFVHGIKNTGSGYATMTTGAHNNNDGNYNFMGGVSNESGGGGAFYWGQALDGTGGDETAFFGRSNIRPADSGGNLYYLIVGNGTTTGNPDDGYVRLVPSDAFRVYRDGRIEAPSFESASITGDYDLTTKKYVDDEISGAAALQGKYRFNSATTASDPGAGKLKYDNATLASVTNIYISKNTDENGSDASNWLSKLGTGDVFYVQTAKDASEYISVTLTGPSVDNAGWFTLPVSTDDSGAIHSNNEKVSAVLIYTNSGGDDSNYAKLNASNTFTGLENIFGQLGGQSITTFYDYIQFQNSNNTRSGSFYMNYLGGINTLAIEGTDELHVYSSDGNFKLSAFSGSVWINKTIAELDAETNLKSAATIGWVADYLANNPPSVSETDPLSWKKTGTTVVTNPVIDGEVTFISDLKDITTFKGTGVSTRVIIDGLNNNGISLQNNSTPAWSLASYQPIGDNYSFVFYNDQTSIASLFIDGTSDYIGISTNSPNSKLDVVGGNIEVDTDPTLDTHVGNRGYNDARYAQLSTDNTFTGVANSFKNIDIGANFTLDLLEDALVRYYDDVGVVQLTVGYDSFTNVMRYSMQDTMEFRMNNNPINFIQGSGIVNFDGTVNFDGRVKGRWQYYTGVDSTTSNVSIVNTDSGNVIYFTGASNLTISIDELTFGFTPGEQFSIVQAGLGTLTITTSNFGTVLKKVTTPITDGKGSIVQCIYYASDSIHIFGDLVAN